MELVLVEAVLSTLFPLPSVLPLKSACSLDSLPGRHGRQLDLPQHGSEQPLRYRRLQIIVTLFAVAALSSAPKDAGGDTGATEEVVTIICNPQ